MLQKSIIIIRHTLPLWQTHFSKLHFYPDCIQILDIIPQKWVKHQLSAILEPRLVNIKFNFKFRIWSISRLGFNGISNQFTYTFNSINEFKIYNMKYWMFRQILQMQFFSLDKKIDSTEKYKFG